MSHSRVSSKFQVVIPKDVREQVRLRMGQTVEVIAKDGVITLVPDRPLRQLRGYVKGLSMKPIREKKDRV